MPSHRLSNSPSAADPSSSDSSGDAVSLPALPSPSPSSSSPVTFPFQQEMWSYLWIPFLISLSKDFAPAKAQTILLPSQLGRDSLPPPSCPAPDAKLNYRPVIGILSHPGDGASGRLSNASTASYIAASYVKFVESAGARVIPIIYNEPLDVIFQVIPLSRPSDFDHKVEIWLKVFIYKIYLNKCIVSSFLCTGFDFSEE